MKHFFFISLCFLFSNFYQLCAQDFIIKNLQVDIQLEEDATILVTEKFDVFFNERRRGIFREIPFRFKTETGESIGTRISNIKVPNQQSKITRKNGIVNIRIGNPNRYITGNQYYEISYQVDQPVLQLDNRTELLWNMAAHNWEVPTENFSYTFTMPNDFVMPDTDMKVLSGRVNAEETGITSIKKVGRVISGESSRPLQPGEGVTLALNFPKDYFDLSQSTSADQTDNRNDRGFRSTGDSSRKEDRGFWLVGLIGGIFAWFYKKYGRNKHVANIRATYYPPEGMSAPEVGTFYDYQANTRDLVSLLPKWGQEGLIEVNSLPNEKGERDMYFIKKNEVSATAPDYEKTMFNGLFRENTQVFLTDLKEKYYQELHKAKSQVKKEVSDPRLYDSKAKKYFHSPWNLVIGILLIPLAIILMIKFKAIFTGIIMIVLGIVLIVVKFLRPKLSEEGLQLHHRLEALKIFLEDPDPEKIDELMKDNPNYLDFIFPYVVAFGLDKTWDVAMQKSSHMAYSPHWYIYHDNLGHKSSGTFSDFTTNFNVATIQSVFTSAPASAGGSGGSSFGGGSSGGGFGGGGGGSW